MNIVAVIPARAGSKGIPNKNIKLLNGHPLIYYALMNAKSSRFINRIVVSTDSEEVRIIAEQMGASVVWRDEALCKDDVTLDAVIFDAVKNFLSDTDYVVTMQPTSPTLTPKTLDNAIESAIAQGYDTMISVINHPHLGWKKENGSIVPDYVERKNRQYLPPHYMETGAFVVSKAKCVTPTSRIGQKVGVYEISEKESVDIDSFADWIVASSFLAQERVAIYVNGNNKRGLGHVYRALEIADEFTSKPDIYFDSNQTDVHIFGNTTHNLIPVNGVEELFEKCQERRYTIFINDILSTSADYMDGLKNALPEAKIINFEDDGEGRAKADLVFNALLDKDDSPNVYAGEKYYICGKLFSFYRPIEIKDQVKRAFVSFGGADPQNYSDRLLKIVSKDGYKDIEFVVALGRAKQNIEELMKYNSRQNIRVLFDVKNMPEVMSSCDIGITSRGRTGYELALLGIPSFAMAQNAREEKHGFVCDANGFTYLGLNPSDEVIETTLRIYLAMAKDERLSLQNKLLSHDLKNGRKRVMGLIKSI